MPALTKFDDWQVRYAAFIAQRQPMPFAWGSNDCATFSADCVLALTGVDVALPELRQHSTDLQAARVLKSHGGLIGIATAALGEPVAAAYAQIGDVVLSKSGDRDMLAICNGATAIAPGPVELVHLPLDLRSKCWRIG